MNEYVIVRRTPSLFGLLLVAGFILWIWKWVILAVGVLAALVLLYYGVKAFVRFREENARLNAHLAEIRAMENEATGLRADVENALWHAGDPRGTYGLDTHDGKEPGS